MERMNLKKLVITTICLLPLLGCVEEFEPENITFESALVVEATITNELKTQEVKLSRTFEFQTEEPDPERNANVRLLDDQGNSFGFNEITPGNYHSISEFSAESGRTYTLQITTNNGRSYSSDPAQLTAVTQLDSLYAERIVNNNGQDGVGIFVDSFDPSGNSQNYRYTYEESYRIIAPRWTPFRLEGDPEGGCGLFVVPRENEEQVCYATDESTDIIQVSTNSFDEDRH